jgi:phospholipid-binding lipoprotein MlaA
VTPARPYRRLLVLVALLLAGCATGTDPRDPYENINRGIYRFNDRVDKAVLKPVAQTYRTVVPDFLRLGVSNVFSNIDDVFIAVNNALQGKLRTAYSDFGRVLINSTLGLGGLFDIASEAGIDKHEEDFGQTLGYWGLGDGPYLVLPIFGPSSGRDLAGRAVDWYSDPIILVDPTHVRNTIRGARVVNDRAELLEVGTLLSDAALDEYQFVRDAYLQRRRALVHDGAAPPDPEFQYPGPDGSRDEARDARTSPVVSALTRGPLPAQPRHAPAP